MSKEIYKCSYEFPCVSKELKDNVYICKEGCSGNCQYKEKCRKIKFAVETPMYISVDMTQEEIDKMFSENFEGKEIIWCEDNEELFWGE